MCKKECLILKMIFATICVCTVMYTCAYAFQIDSDKTCYNSDTKKYHIECSADFAEQPIKVEVLNNKITTNNLKSVTIDNIKDIYYYINQFSADENGDFSTDINMNNVGNYTLIITALDSDYKYSAGFATYAYDEVVKAINSYINDKKTETVKNITENYYGALGIDFNDISALSEDLQNNVYSFVNESTITNDTDFKNAVNKYLAIELINNEDNWKNIYTYLSKYSTRLSINDDICFEALVTMDNTTIQKVCEGMINNNLTCDGLINVLDKDVILNLIKSSLWNEVYDVLTNYNTKLCIDFTAYNNKSDTAKQNIMTQFKSSLDSQSISSLTQIKTLFDNAVEDDATTTTVLPSKKESNGGGSSSSYTVSTVIPISDTQNSNNTSADVFNDLGDVEWAKPDIIHLYNKGIINGKSNEKFCPNDNITREEFLKILIEGFKIADANAECSFNDVRSDDWYYKYVATAQKLGITNGISSDSFGISSNITREDMAVLSVRTAKALGYLTKEQNTAIGFDDNDLISDYAYDSTSLLCKLGLLNGTGNKFEPLRNTTRAEASALLFRLFKFVGIL